MNWSELSDSELRRRLEQRGRTEAEARRMVRERDTRAGAEAIDLALGD